LKNAGKQMKMDEKLAEAVKLANLQKWSRLSHENFEELVNLGTWKDPSHVRHHIYSRTYGKILAMCVDVREKNILDLGCGSGVCTTWLARDGACSFGLDISRGMIQVDLERERRQGVECHFVVADIEHLPFHQGAFDFIISFAALHHVPNPSYALAEAARVSKQLILYEPNSRSLPHRMVNLYKDIVAKKSGYGGFKRGLIEVHSSFSPYLLEELLKSIGFTKVKMMPIGFVPWFLGLPLIIVRLLTSLEYVLENLPVLRWQCGDVLVLASK